MTSLITVICTSCKKITYRSPKGSRVCAWCKGELVPHE